MIVHNAYLPDPIDFKLKPLCGVRGRIKLTKNWEYVNCKKCLARTTIQNREARNSYVAKQIAEWDRVNK